MPVIDVTIIPDGLVPAGFTTTVTVGGVTTANPTLRRNQDDIRWINNTGYKVVLFFPHDSVLGDDDAFHEIIHIGKKHRRVGPDLTVNPLIHYPYAIFVHGMFAHGSDLEVIVQ